MTEEQAKKKFCKWNQIISMLGLMNISLNIKDNLPKVLIERMTKTVEQLGNQTRCDASDCMMWKEVHPLTLPEDDPNVKHGYCGLTLNT